MNPWLAFIIGLLVGWLIEWIIDWFYWRKREDETAALKAELTAANERIATLEADLNASRSAAINWEGKYNDLDQDCQGRLSALELEWKEKVDGLEGDLATAKLAAGAGLAGAVAASIDTDDVEYDARIPDLDVDLDPIEAEVEVVEVVETVEVEAPDIDLPEVDIDLPEVAGAAAVAGMASRSGDLEVEIDSPDNLRLINGIGPRFESKLNDAGIYRFEQLAAMDAPSLEAIIEPKDWQKFDYDSWIAQAAVLANQPREGASGDDLTIIEGIGPKYNSLLNASGITTFEQVSNASEDELADIISAPAWRNVSYADWIAQAKLAAAGDDAGLQELQDQLHNRRANNIRLIGGMGDKYATALEAAGFGTFAAIAAASPDELQNVTASAGLRSANYDEWIEEAKLRAAGKRVPRKRRRRSTNGGQVVACPQDLSAVKGIGRVYEQRLYIAGIGTYWELAESTNEELADILLAEDFQDVHYNDIKADALRLAHETETTNRFWDGTEPDDFEILAGIGEVLEGRLYAAGICTFEAMAQLTPEQLADICKAPPMNRPDYAGWLETARQRAAGKGE